jgi:hypothetical protein
MEALVNPYPLMCLPTSGFMASFLGNSNLTCLLGEHFEKQTARSRFEIAGPNGKQVLSLPIIHKSSHQTVVEVQIDNAQNWRVKHWRSIETAYNKAPFFEFYAHYFYPLFTHKYHLLAEFNLEAIYAIFKALKVKKSLTLNLEPSPVLGPIELKQTANYNQVFIEKNGFISHLSVIDLIFNEGPNAMDFLV